MLTIEVTGTNCNCTCEGKLSDICAETMFALLALIEAIEKADVKMAKAFKSKLPIICSAVSLYNFTEGGAE